MILRALLLLLALVPAAGLGLLLWCCGRRSVPDFWQESALLTRGKGRRREEVLAGKAWLERQHLEPVETESDDELRLRGTFLRKKKGALGTVLLLHDFRSSWKLDFSGLARFLYEEGYQLLFVDQRAHGESRGFWSTCGIWERYDVRGWTNYLAMRFADTHSIWIYGCGMGGTAALLASSLELSGVVRGIIAEDAWSSPYRWLKHRADAFFSPIPTAPALRLMDLCAWVFVGFSLRDLDAEQAVAESAYPILLIHGTENRRVPLTVPLKIQARAPAGRCGLLKVEGAGEGLCRAVAGQQVEDALRRLFREG